MSSGDVLCVWTATNSTPPATTYATLDTRNVHAVLDFDAATDEAVFFEDVLPLNYSGGGLTVGVYFMASTATSGNVVWGGAVEREFDSSTDLDSDSFATEQTVTIATAGTSGIVAKGSITHSSGANMDSVAAGEPFRYRLRRIGSSGSDTMAGDAEMLRVVVAET